MPKVYRQLALVSGWLLSVCGVILVVVGSSNLPTSLPDLDQASLISPAVIITAPQPAVNPVSGQVKGVETVLETGDGRAELVTRFLDRYNSPLTPHEAWGQTLVAIADRYGIDFRLLPAIAMQESNLCKNIPPGSYNCLGFGIHERGTLEFESFEANFDRAGRELKRFYIDQGRLTPEDIMRKYTPGSNGSWAESVNQWMTEMRYDDRASGIERKENANVLEFVPGR